MSARCLALAGGAFMAILAAPVAADPCSDLRFALARESLASRMFNETESEATGLAWQDASETTRLAADVVRYVGPAGAFAEQLSLLATGLDLVGRASEESFSVSGIVSGKAGVVPKRLMPMVNSVLDAYHAVRDAYHETLLTACRLGERTP